MLPYLRAHNFGLATPLNIYLSLTKRMCLFSLGLAVARAKVSGCDEYRESKNYVSFRFLILFNTTGSESKADQQSVLCWQMEFITVLFPQFMKP